jgi:hypothetical protein
MTQLQFFAWSECPRPGLELWAHQCRNFSAPPEQMGWNQFTAIPSPDACVLMRWLPFWLRFLAKSVGLNVPFFDGKQDSPTGNHLKN